MSIIKTLESPGTVGHWQAGPLRPLRGDLCHDHAVMARALIMMPVSQARNHDLDLSVYGHSGQSRWQAAARWRWPASELGTRDQTEPRRARQLSAAPGRPPATRRRAGGRRRDSDPSVRFIFNIRAPPHLPGTVAESDSPLYIKKIAASAEAADSAEVRFGVARLKYHDGSFNKNQFFFF